MSLILFTRWLNSPEMAQVSLRVCSTLPHCGRLEPLDKYFLIIYYSKMQSPIISKLCGIIAQLMNFRSEEFLQPAMMGQRNMTQNVKSGSTLLHLPYVFVSVSIRIISFTCYTIATIQIAYIDCWQVRKTSWLALPNNTEYNYAISILTTEMQLFVTGE